MQKLKILLSWLLLAGGSYFVFSGAREYLASRNSQEQAAESWKSYTPAEAHEQDGRIVPPGTAGSSRIAAGEAFARLTIPRLHTVLYVVEGTNHRDLRRGPGHLEGSAFPGGKGNCVIAGHRDTHFRSLKDIQRGDRIELETQDGDFVYRVSGISIVTPDNTDSLRPTEQPVLNLVTCYPFSYVGSAPKRFVVHAERVTSQAAQGELPPGS